MRTRLLAGAGMLAVLAMPVALQAQADPAVPVVTPDGRLYAMTPAQQATFDAWAADRQADYKTWPNEYQAYFWTLPENQQTGYWALTGDQRGMIYKMSPDQRAKAWDSVLAQLAGSTPATPADQANPPGMGMPTTGVPNPQAAAQAVPPAMPADPSYQGGPYKGALTPPPADAMAKSYPICTSKVQDSCQNPGEGGARGRSRAADRKRGT
jgi:hypothetical protein